MSRRGTYLKRKRATNFIVMAVRTLNVSIHAQKETPPSWEHALGLAEYVFDGAKFLDVDGIRDACRQVGTDEDVEGALRLL
jgi:hypothetical protein